MNFNFKKISILAAGIAFIGILSYATQFTYQEKEISPNTLSLVNDLYTNIVPNQTNATKDFYQTWLQEEEQKIWQEVAALTDVSYDQCKTLVTEFQKAHDEETAQLTQQIKIDKEVSPAVKKLIEDIAKDFGINSIAIVSCNYPVPAATHGPVVFVNEEIFTNIPLAAQQFVIAHEMVHIVHQDDEMRFVLKNKNYFMNDNNGLDDAINKLYRFHELRADILAALTSKKYADGYVAYVKNALERRDNEEITELFYPTYALRQTTSEKIQALAV